MKHAELTQDQLRAALDFNARTGVFTWLSANKRRRAGEVAGSVGPKGYVLIGLNGRQWLAHRLAWLWVHGAMPPELDHVNGVRHDNRIVNLRLADRMTNSQNLRRAHVGNSSGKLGVSWSKHHGKWKAQIVASGRKVNLGYFDDKLDAQEAYMRARGELQRGNTLTTPQTIDALTQVMVEMCTVGT